MSKQTFDFSEALKRMRQGKKVKRNGWSVVMDGIAIDNDGNLAMFYKEGNEPTWHTIHSSWNFFSLDDILATDWEEVEG